jgi:regulator of sigma E protease
LRRIVAERPGRTVTIRLERDGGPRNFDATLGVREQDGARLGYLGIGPAPTPRYVHERQYGPLGALGASLGRTWDSTGFTIRMLARMVTGDVSVRNLSGPLSIAQYAGGSAAAGPGAFIDFLAVVSLSLGVLNLLPIPVLDGGQVVYQLIELVKGSPLSDRSQLVGQQVGIIALLILMSFAFYNDIARIFG